MLSMPQTTKPRGVHRHPPEPHKPVALAPSSGRVSDDFGAADTRIKLPEVLLLVVQSKDKMKKGAAGRDAPAVRHDSQTTAAPAK